MKTYLKNLIDEKGYDREQMLVVDGPSGENYIPLAIVEDAILGAPKHEQKGIRNVLVKIDFMNGDCLDYFRHLAQAIAI